MLTFLSTKKSKISTNKRPIGFFHGQKKSAMHRPGRNLWLKKRSRTLRDKYLRTELGSALENPVLWVHLERTAQATKGLETYRWNILPVEYLPIAFN